MSFLLFHSLQHYLQYARIIHKERKGKKKGRGGRSWPDTISSSLSPLHFRKEGKRKRGRKERNEASIPFTITSLFSVRPAPPKKGEREEWLSER